jgi:hypothetical protein
VEDARAQGWLDRLPGAWETVLGNHDILHNIRSPAEWARAYARPSQNFVVTLPFVTVIVLGPDRNHVEAHAGTLAPSTLAFLDRELARAPGDCWVACHWPLFRTVMGDPRRHFTSAMAPFYAKPDDEIRKVLARHRNARAWLSGHTHSPLSVPGLITRAKLPHRRSIRAINLSALVGTGRRRDPRDPLRSLYLTHHPGRIEVRFRDHRAREWIKVRGRRVATLSV